MAFRGRLSTVGAGARAFLGPGRVSASPTQQVREYCQKSSASESSSKIRKRSIRHSQFNFFYLGAVVSSVTYAIWFDVKARRVLKEICA